MKDLEIRIKSIDPPMEFNVLVWKDMGKEKVSFYDPRFDFTERGQFICSYYLETLLEDKEALMMNGLNLFASEPSWSVDGFGMRKLFSEVEEAKIRYEVDSKPYGKKVEAIRKAMKEGMIFYVDTYIGKLGIKGISSDGSWAMTGSGFTQRSWAICSTDINRWYRQLLNVFPLKPEEKEALIANGILKEVK